MAKSRARRRRILDQAKAETGALIADKIRQRALANVPDALKKLSTTDKQKLEVVIGELRKTARRNEVNRTLAEQVLQDPVSSILGRIKKRAAGELGDEPLSKTERELSDLAGNTKLKPRFAVVSPLAEAQVVKRIKDAQKGSPALAKAFDDLGLSVEDGTALMFRVLDYSKARSAAGVKRRIDSRGGVLYETLLPSQPGVIREERLATAKNAADWIRQDPKRFGARNAQQAEKLAQEVSDALTATNKPPTNKLFVGDAEGAGVGEIELLADNLWLVRLTQVTDESGKLASDHVRTLVSFTPDRQAIDLTPSGFGESKFKSGYAKIVAQTIANIRRARDTLRAANLPNVEGLEIRVRWGKALTVVIQSEKAPPKAGLDNLVGSVRSAVGAPKMTVRPVVVVTPEQAKSSRRVIDLFMKLVKDLKLDE